MKLSYSVLSLCCARVRGDSIGWNHPELRWNCGGTWHEFVTMRYIMCTHSLEVSRTFHSSTFQTAHSLEPPWTHVKLSYSALSLCCGRVRGDSIGWNHPEEFEVVQQHRNSTNHCDSNHCVAGGSMPTGQVRVSSGWFHDTEPPWTTVIQGEAGLQCSFERVRGGLISSNLLEPLCCRGKQAYRAGSNEFWVVWPH